MIWENYEEDFEEEKKTAESSDSDSPTKEQSLNLHINEDKKALQLLKFKDPALDSQRTQYTTILKKFDDLIHQNKHQQIIETFLTKDCEIFIFNMARKDWVQYTSVELRPKSLHEGVRILKRQVRETYVDVEKKTCIQISICRLRYDDNGSEGEEITLEIFSFKGDKISKYRVSFGVWTEAHGSEGPFEPTRKDIMLAKVKQISYALADKLNLNKVASLLDQKTEYKVWSWENQKCFVFNKYNLATDFKNLEENYKVKQIVPYEIYSEREYIIGTYTYHLEHKISEKKFIWLNTCIYTFDKDLELSQIAQQGEFYLENEIEIPFQESSRQKIEQRFIDMSKNIKTNSDFIYHDDFNFDCDIYRFGPFKSVNIGHFQGLNQVQKLTEILLAGYIDFEWIKVVDCYVDLQHPSYDVGIALNCGYGKVVKEGHNFQGVMMNFFNISRLSFENGKVAKVCQFFSLIPKEIPTPFDDPDFEALNISRNLNASEMNFI